MNLRVVALGAALALPLCITPNLIIQAQTNESQPVDQVNVTKVTGAVQKVDLDKRIMTLKLDNGGKRTLRVDKRVNGLDQFKPGDRVQLSYTQEIVAMAEPSDQGAAKLAKYGAVDIEPEGDNPALVKVDTTEIAGKVVSIDRKMRRLTFEDPNGKKRTLKLSHRIQDLDQFRPGDNIDMAITDEMVVQVIRA